MTDRLPLCRASLRFLPLASVAGSISLHLEVKGKELYDNRRYIRRTVLQIIMVWLLTTPSVLSFVSLSGSNGQARISHSFIITILSFNQHISKCVLVLF